MIERVNRVLKYSFKAQPDHYKRLDNFSWVFLALRAAPKEDHNLSSAQVTLGTTLRLSGQLLSSPRTGDFVNQTEYARNLESSLYSLPAYHQLRDISILSRSDKIYTWI